MGLDQKIAKVADGAGEEVLVVDEVTKNTDQKKHLNGDLIVERVDQNGKCDRRNLRCYNYNRTCHFSADCLVQRRTEVVI